MGPEWVAPFFCLLGRVRPGNYPVTLMFGSFTEEALANYNDLVSHREKQKRVKSAQGTEMMDNFGVSDTDHDFLDADESMDADDYTEFFDYTTCIRSNGSRYGIAPGKKCRKGTEGEPATKEQKGQARLKKKIQGEISNSTRLKSLSKEVSRRKHAIKQREEFIKANRYPIQKPSMEAEIANIKGEIANLNKLITAERRRIAKRVADSEQKPTKAQRLGRLSATKARAEKVLADLRKEKPESDTERSARLGVFNKSLWD